MVKDFPVTEVDAGSIPVWFVLYIGGFNDRNVIFIVIGLGLIPNALT